MRLCIQNLSCDRRGWWNYNLKSRARSKRKLFHTAAPVCVCVAVTREIQTDTFGIASAEMCPCFDGNALTRRKNQSSKSKFTRDILFLSVAASRNVTVTRFPFRCFHVNHITEKFGCFFLRIVFCFQILFDWAKRARANPCASSSNCYLDLWVQCVAA